MLGMQIYIRRWTAPRNLFDGFRWHFQLMQAVCCLFGREYVVEALGQLSRSAAGMQITTMFSGLDMAAQAWEMIQAAALEVLGVVVSVRLGSMAEIEKGCTKFLKAAWPDRCCFGDVRQWASKPPQDQDEWRLDDIELHRLAYCSNHDKQCRLYQRVLLDVSGPPCILWSRPALGPKTPPPFTSLETKRRGVAPCCHHFDCCLRLGSRLGVEDKARVKVHLAYVAKILRYPPQIAVHENVPDYDEDVLQPLKQAGFQIHVAQLDPRLFGWPLSRPRKYRIMVNTNVREWVFEAGRAASNSWQPHHIASQSLPAHHGSHITMAASTSHQPHHVAHRSGRLQITLATSHCINIQHGAGPHLPGLLR